MSSMLKQAIIDATALKEAALKNAEQSILEKYSKEVKKAVSNILEQEDPLGGMDMGGEPAAGGEDPLAGGGEDPLAAAPEGAAPEGEEEEESKFEEDNLITPSYLEGDEISSRDGNFTFDTPDEGDNVSIDISPEEIAQFLSDADQNDFGDIIDDRFEDFEADLDDEEIEVDLSALGGLVDDEVESLGLTDDEVEIDDEELQMIAEEVFDHTDVEVQPHGHPGSATDVDLEYAIDMALAKAMSDEAEEENEKLQDTIEELEESNRKFKSNNKILRENNNKLKNTVLQMKDKLEESIVTNAKLLYSNRVLISASLNERQKNKLVEALQNAQTVDEARTIYETLHGTISTRNSSRTNESLNETLVRNRGKSSMLPRSKSNEVKAQDNVMSRMQRLAGIK